MKILLLVPLIALAQDQSGSISGVVTDSITHQPVKRAMVAIRSISGVIGLDSRGQPQRQSAATDSTGAYTFSPINPGRYFVSVSHQNYPEPVNKEIEIQSGENTLNLTLNPGASISGRVLDEDGDPLAGCFVQPHPANHPDQGAGVRGGIQPGGEDGDYRLFGLASGKYIVGATCSAPVFQPRPLSAGPDPPPSSAYPMQYYPLAPDAKSAEVIQLFPGMEKAGVDFRMKPAPVTEIRGRFSLGGAEWRGSNIVAQLIPVDARGYGRNTIGARIDPAKGTFYFPQVFPGTYLIVANSTSDAGTIGAEQRVEVKDRPLDVTVELHAAVDLSGTVRVEGTLPSGVTLSQVSIQLIPEARQMHVPPLTQANNDGTFTIARVAPGHWRLMVNGPTVFLKSARLGVEDVTDRVIDLSGGPPGPLALVLGTDLGTIQGTAPAGYMVIARRILDSGDEFNSAGVASDASGRFAIRNLAPGRYRVTATAGGGMQRDDGGQEVRLGEGETVTVELKAPANP